MAGPMALPLVALTYFLLLAGTGAWVPFLALHLQRRGFEGAEVGGMLAALSVGRIAATPFWAWLGDRTGKGTRLLQLAAVLSTGGAALAIGSDSLLAMVGALALYAACRGPMGPLLDAHTVAALERAGHNPHRYGRVRLWGSVGFLAAGFYAGTRADADPDFPMRLAVGLWAVGAVATFAFPTRVQAVPAAPGPALRALVQRRWFVPWVIGCVLQGLSLSAYDSLYAVHISAQGLPSWWTGAALVAGVSMEVSVMAAGPWVLQRWSPWRMLIVGAVVAAARWGLTAWLHDGLPLTLVQALHGVSFAAFWLGGVELMRREAPSAIRASAQALFTVASYGLGPLLMSGMTALLLDRHGTQAIFGLDAALCVVACGCFAVAAGRARLAPAAPDVAP